MDGTVKTVGDLKKALANFSDDTEIRLVVAWYDRHNYNYVAPSKYDFHNGQGIEVCVEADDGCCVLSNENTEDIEMYI